MYLHNYIFDRMHRSIGCIENQKKVLNVNKSASMFKFRKIFHIANTGKNSKYTYTGQYFDTLKFMSALCADITEVALICREKNK